MGIAVNIHYWCQHIIDISCLLFINWWRFSFIFPAPTVLLFLLVSYKIKYYLWEIDCDHDRSRVVSDYLGIFSVCQFSQATPLNHLFYYCSFTSAEWFCICFTRILTPLCMVLLELYAILVTGRLILQCPSHISEPNCVMALVIDWISFLSSKFSEYLGIKIYL